MRKVLHIIQFSFYLKLHISLVVILYYLRSIQVKLNYVSFQCNTAFVTCKPFYSKRNMFLFSILSETIICNVPGKPGNILHWMAVLPLRKCKWMSRESIIPLKVENVTYLISINQFVPRNPLFQKWWFTSRIQRKKIIFCINRIIDAENKIPKRN